MMHKTPPKGKLFRCVLFVFSCAVLLVRCGDVAQQLRHLGLLSLQLSSPVFPSSQTAIRVSPNSEITGLFNLVKAMSGVFRSFASVLLCPCMIASPIPTIQNSRSQPRASASSNNVPCLHVPRARGISGASGRPHLSFPPALLTAFHEFHFQGTSRPRRLFSPF